MNEEEQNTLIVSWSIEQPDNGYTIEDRETLQKEAAIYEDNNAHDTTAIKLKLGEWFYGELSRFLKGFETCNARVTIQFEDEL